MERDARRAGDVVEEAAGRLADVERGRIVEGLKRRERAEDSLASLSLGSLVLLLYFRCRIDMTRVLLITLERVSRCRRASVHADTEKREPRARIPIVRDAKKVAT